MAAAGLALIAPLSESMASCSANSKVNVGLVGCNGMGFVDLKTFLEIKCS